MKISFLFKGVLVAAVLVLLPAALPASPKPAGQGTVVVNPAAFAEDDSPLLNQIQFYAAGVRNDADHLREMLREGDRTGWEGDAYLLSDAGDQVNELNKLLYNLRIRQAEASPLQQETIQRIVPSALELATTTQDALTTMHNNQSHVQLTDLPCLADAIYNQADRVASTVAELNK